MTAIDTRIEHYFDRAADPDLEAYFAQFADDAVVEDEGGSTTASTPSAPGGPRCRT